METEAYKFVSQMDESLIVTLKAVALIPVIWIVMLMVLKTVNKK